MRTYVASYEFALANDWWTINELSLYMPIKTKLMVHSYLKFSSIFFNMCCLYLLFDMCGNYLVFIK